jgi:hypothetical protein
MNDSIYSKSKPLHPVNIWNDNTNNEINDSCLAISITNTINIEHYMIYDLAFLLNHVTYQTKNHKF